MSYANLVTSAGSSEIFRSSSSTGSGDKSIYRNISGVTVDSAGFWVSALLRFSSGTSGRVTFASSANGSYSRDHFIGFTASGQLTAGGGSNSGNSGATTYDANSTHLVVANYKSSTGRPIDVWINPADLSNLGDPDYTWSGDQATTTTRIDSMTLLAATAQGSSFIYDEIRLGNSVADVLPEGEAAADPPSITLQPESQTVVEGEPVEFSVTAIGTDPLFFQWRKDSAPINDATNRTYSIAETIQSDAADYNVVITNSAGSVTSSVVTLTINDQYRVYYNGNSNTGGTVPEDENGYYPGNNTVTVLGNINGLTKTGHSFIGWSTAAGGSVTLYNADDTFTISSPSVTLYAQWELDVATGQPLLYDGFIAGGNMPESASGEYQSDPATTDGTDNDSLKEQNPTVAGFSTAWTANPLADYVYPRVNDSGLEYDGLYTMPGAVEWLRTNDATDERTISRDVKWVTVDSAGFWVSALLRFSSGTAGRIIINSSEFGSFNRDHYIGFTATGQLTAGCAEYSGNSGATTYAADTTYLVVANFKSGPSGNRPIDVWINPADIENLGSPDYTWDGNMADTTVRIDRWSLRAELSQGSSFFYDEIRLGNSADQVLITPPLPAGTVFSFK